MKGSKEFALCLENTGNEASLILGRVYRVVPDERAAKDDLVRIIDEFPSNRDSEFGADGHSSIGRGVDGRSQDG